MSTNWRRMCEAEASVFWDTYLESFEKASPFQSYEWGQYQKTLGWEPLYLVCADANQNIQSMFLGHFWPLNFSCGIVTSSGGPIGDAAKWGDELRRSVRISAGVRRVYLRLRCDRSDDDNCSEILQSNDWTAPFSQKTSGLTMELDIEKSETKLFAGLSKNWKKNLKSARNKGLTVREAFEPNVAEILPLFNSLETRKKLPKMWSEKKLQALLDQFGPRLKILFCEDNKGKLLAVRVSALQSNFAVDYLAASNTAGRKARASYFLLWEMFSRCRSEGITSYDLGGIDPKINSGVYYFKKGTGAKSVKQIGELDWATDKYLRAFSNLAIAIHDNLKSIRIRPRPKPERTRLGITAYRETSSFKKSRAN